MANNADAFGGFSPLVDMLIRTSDSPKDVTKSDNNTTIVKLSKSVDDDTDDVAVIKDDDTEPVIVDKKEPKKVDDKQVDVKDNKSTDDDQTDDNDDDDQTDDTTDLGETEPEISSYFGSSLIEKLGIELKEEPKFDKLDDVIDFMGKVIEENSIPEFANEEVAEYDKYVRNGGNLKSFYDTIYAGSIDVNSLDLEDEDDCKKLISANLKELGYKDDRIAKTIKRYEDAEVLKEEAVDAKESYEELKSKQAKTLLANQEKENIAMQKRNTEFVDNVTKYVNVLKEINGVDIDPKTKKEIIDYIFRPMPDGMTQYQKAYAQDVVKNLVGSAYYQKYADTLFNKTSKKATDVALNKVREKLKASKGKRNTGSGGQGLGKTSPNFSTISSLILKS